MKALCKLYIQYILLFCDCFPNYGICLIHQAWKGLLWLLRGKQLKPCRHSLRPLLLFFSPQLTSDSVTPWTAECQAPLSFTISQSLLRFMSVEWVMLSNHLFHFCPLLLLPSIFPSIRFFFFFSSESAFCIKWPKYWNFSFSISLSNKYSGLISFKIDSLDLLAAQRTPNSPLQLHSQKPSVIQHAAFFMVQFSHLNMTTGNTIALTIQIFVSKVMSLLFGMLSRFVIAFLPRSKCVLISWLQRLSQWFQSPRK